MSAFGLASTFFFAFVLKVATLTDEAKDVLTDELRDTYVFNAAVVTVGMAGSIAAAVVLATCMAGLQLAKAAREPILKLVETRAAPELTLRPEHRWHLFLSHIWATGQAHGLLPPKTHSPSSHTA